MDRTRDHASYAPEFNTDSIQYPEVADQAWSHPATRHDEKGATAGVSQYATSPFLEPDAQEKIARPTVQRTDKRRIAGLPPCAFWLVLCAAGLVVIGASVGGAVGGSAAMRTHHSSEESASMSAPAATVSSSPTSSAPPTTTSSSSSPLPTVTTGCPDINGTEHSGISDPVGGTSPDTFIKLCGGTNTQWVKVDHQLMSASVPSFDACIQMCSNWNFWHANDGLPRCITAALMPDGEPPWGCWITNDTVQVEKYRLAIGALVQ